MSNLSLERPELELPKYGRSLTAHYLHSCIIIGPFADIFGGNGGVQSHGF